MKKIWGGGGLQECLQEIPQFACKVRAIARHLITGQSILMKDHLISLYFGSVI